MNFKPCEEAYYYDDHTVLKVEVIENTSDRHNESYLLAVREIVREGIYAAFLKVGWVFNCNKMRGLDSRMVWDLSKELLE